MKKYAINISFITGILSCIGTICFAQDIHFSQLNACPLKNASALTGFMNADLRICSIYRNQWSSIPVPYRTFYFSADGKLYNLFSKLKGYNAGIDISQDVAGDAQLSTLQMKASFSKEITLTTDSLNSISFGTAFGFIQKSIDFNKLSFDNQFNGDQYNPLAPTGESLSRTSYLSPDINFSMAYLHRYKKGEFIFSMNASHLNKPKNSFYNDVESRLPILYQFMLSDVYIISEKYMLLPLASATFQQQHQEYLAGTELKIIMQNELSKKYAVGMGLYLRYNDAVIPAISIYRNKFRFGFSYDINYSKLNAATNYRGGPEFSLIYMASKIRPTISNHKICPIY